MVMFSPGSLTTGASSRNRSSTARAFITDARENGSMSNSGIAFDTPLPRGRNAAVHVQNFAVDERSRAGEQKCAGLGVVLLAPEPAQRDGAGAAGVFGLVIQSERARSRHRTRRDGVDAHIARPQFGG